MTSDIDELPDSELPEKEGKTNRKQVFTFGATDEDEEPDLEQQQEEEPLLGLEGQPLEPLPEPPAGPAPTVTFNPEVAGEVNLVELKAAAELALQDPALRRLNEISTERFKTKKPPTEAGAKVTRPWLENLEQRHFFLAIGYPGSYLFRLMQNNASLGQIRAWVDGLETVPPLLRRILTLEHLLDRRTLANRRRMPTRRQIEDALRVMPAAAPVSEVLGGFENIDPRDLQRHPPSNQLKEGTTGEVRQMLRVVRPGETAPIKPRRGASLPLNPRLQGKGRPLGQRLHKPDPYCYTLSRKSMDDMGVPRITPLEAMELINRVADLEQEFGVIYSLRKQDPNQPWMLSNIEFLPADELEKERTATMRRARGEE